MNKRADADPSVGSSGHGWRADADRGGDGWQDRSGDRPASGMAVPWGDGRGDHERTDHPWKGHEPAGKYDDVQASGRSLHHHDPELISDPSSDPSSDPGGDPGADASTDLGGLAVLIGGFAAASGELTLATGAVQSTAQERAGVSIAWGAAVFEAYGYGQQPTEAFAAADTWLQVTGADLLLHWDLENSGSDPGADQAWAHSEIDYMAIDIPAWSPAQPLVIELAQAFALQPLAADLGPSSDGSLNYAAVAAAVQADGTNALALTSTQAFTDKSVSFVYAMALASLWSIPSKEVAVSPSNTFLIDMTAAAKALGDYTATYATTSTLAVPGHAIGFAAATAVAQDPAPRTSAETTGHVTHGDIISWHALELSIDFPYGPTPVSVDMSITTLSSHGGGNVLSGYALPDLGGTSLHGLF